MLCSLFLCIDSVNTDASVLDEVSEVMVFDSDMFGPWSKSGGLRNRYAAVIIFEYLAMYFRSGNM